MPELTARLLNESTQQELARLVEPTDGFGADAVHFVSL